MLAALTCPKCSAPIPACALHASVLSCGYCDHVLVKARLPESLPVPVGEWAGPLEDRDKPRIRVGGQPYVLDGLLSRGAQADVLLGHRDQRLTEQVVLRVGRSGRGEALERTWASLRSLQAILTRQVAPSGLPALIARGHLSSGRTVLVFRWMSGFAHTLRDVAKAFPRGLDPRSAVWMLRRGAELMARLHGCGFAHRQVRPEHVLIHARDHGVAFCGWSQLATDLKGDGHRNDLAALATSIGELLPPATPGPLQRLFEAARRGGFDSACGLADATRRAARAAFGPPTFVPLVLPSSAFNPEPRR